MKGLLIKDLYALKGFSRQYVLVVAFMIVFAFFSRNLAFFIIYAMVLSGMMVVSTLSIDETVHFDRWTICSPAGSKGLVLEKYILLLIMIVTGIAVGLLADLIMVKVITDTYSSEWESVLISALLFVIADAVMLPIHFKLGVEKARYVYMATIFAIAFLTAGIFVILDKAGIAAEEFVTDSPAFPVILLGFGALALAVSYKISLKTVRTREW